MSDEEEEYEEEEEAGEEEHTKTSASKDEGAKVSEDKAEFIKLKEHKNAELDEQLAQYIAEWRKQRSKEEAELKQLKERQVKRKAFRAEQDKILEKRKKEEEDRLRREVEEKKQKEQEEKVKRLQEAENRKQLILQAQKIQHEKAKAELDIVRREKALLAATTSQAIDPQEEARAAMMKTKEQLAEEKKISMEIRIKPLKVDGKNEVELRKLGAELWEKLVTLETEKYDLEERQKRQIYDLKELKERQKQQLRHKAMKLGLEPEALLGKYPPKIRVASKFERREDTRTYVEKKGLYDGGHDKIESENNEKNWSEKIELFEKRTKTRLPRWFGERPGKKKDDPPTPEEALANEAVEDLPPEPYFEDEPPPVQEEEEEEEEEEE